MTHLIKLYAVATAHDRPSPRQQDQKKDENAQQQAQSSESRRRCAFFEEGGIGQLGESIGGQVFGEIVQNIFWGWVFCVEFGMESGGGIGSFSFGVGV